ncbi:MAG: DUF302 domain-containing protein [Halarchaeum sp.]
MSYTIDETVDAPFDDVVAATEDALADEGFGVLCDIDVRATLKEKLDEEFRDYRILGACNPPLAHEALETEPGIGALLPCNVVVYADGDEVAVRAVDPHRLLGVVGTDELDDVADDVHERFERVLAAVADEFA